MSQDLRRSTIELHLSDNHNLPASEITPELCSQMKLAKCSGISQSIFKLIHFVLDETTFDGAEYNIDLRNLAEIGVSVSTAMRDELETLEALIEASKERERQQQTRTRKNK